MYYWAYFLALINMQNVLASMTYQVQVNKYLTQLDVKVCSEQPIANQYILDRRSASKNISNLKLYKGKKAIKALKLYKRRLYISNFSLEDCFGYQVNLKRYQLDNDTILIDNRDWLLYPASNHRVKVIFSFEDKSHQVSTPWQQTSKSGANSEYLLSNNSNAQASKTVFGKVYLEKITIKKSTLEIAIVGTQEPKRINEYINWINDTAQILDKHTGLFPQRPVQIILTAKGYQSEAVPWAEVQRDDKVSVHFYVDGYRNINEFYQDWTAIHELSHLYLPRLKMEDLWLSEGLATYYQVILRAKAKITTPTQGWKKLISGFNKGRSADNGLNLRQTNVTHHYYWGGAAYFLMADVALRRNSNKTLFSVMNQFVNCCINDFSIWSAEQFVAKLDELSDTYVFSELLFQEVLSKSFPSVEPVLVELGITNNFWEALCFNQAKNHILRHKIMSP